MQVRAYATGHSLVDMLYFLGCVYEGAVEIYSYCVRQKIQVGVIVGE